MGSLEVCRFHAVGDYLAVAGPFLAAREAQHNLPLGVTATLRDHPEVYPEPPYLGVVVEGGRVLLAAVRTPPFNLVLSEAVDPAALGPLVDDVAQWEPLIPGVIGPTELVRPFVERWAARTGRVGRLDVAERIYQLTRVRPPARPVEGTWRYADDRDRALLGDWVVAFQREAVLDEPAVPDVSAAVERWIRRIDRAMYLWTVGERAVSMVGAGSPTPNGIRIGPVYTPPADRGRGYASALTAAASQDQLDAGRRFCFLFTDLANATSNHIYMAIGYEPVSDVDEFLFADPPGSR